MSPEERAQARCTAAWFPGLTDAERVNLFFPQRRETVDPRAVTACANCPVRQQCEDHAVTHREPGYWGGKSERQRRNNRSKAHHATDLVVQALVDSGRPMTADQLAWSIGRSSSTARQAANVLKKKGLVQTSKVHNPSGGPANTAYLLRKEKV